MPDRVVVALIGDGGFGQNPAALATAFEEDIAVIWVIMNNCAFGTIAGLEKAHYGTTFGTVFEKDGKPWSPDYAAIARAYGIDGVKVALGGRVQAGAGEGDQVEAAGRHRRLHAERAGAHGGPLEHHGHLFARQEGAPRQHGRADATRPTLHAKTPGHEHDYSLAHLTRAVAAPPEMIDVAARTGYGYVGIRPIYMGLPGERTTRSRDNPQMLKETKAALARPGVAVHDIELSRMYRRRSSRRISCRRWKSRPSLGAQGRARRSIWGGERELLHREIRAILRPREAVRTLRDLESPASDRDRQSRRGGATCVRTVNREQCRNHRRHAAFRPARIRGSSSLPRCRANGSSFAHVCDAAEEVPPTDGRRSSASGATSAQFPGEGGIDVRGILSRMPPVVPYRAGDAARRADQGHRAGGSGATRDQRSRAAISTGAANAPDDRPPHTRSAA